MNSIEDNNKYILRINDGPLCGYIEKNIIGTYYKFKKIPYAKPPVGSLRFMPPVPCEPWTQLLDCTQDAPLPLCCLLDENVCGSEDCLYLEVSTPNVNPDKPLPVMFWIGSSLFFCYGDEMYDPSLINNQGIVFVRCGFRLGPLGFLTNMEISAPGNCGLKDIVMALKWVQKNIVSFGGDPKNVTIFGSSTGGSMAHYMILSPMASGLFHKTIIQSFSALNRWSVAKNPVQDVLKLAKELGIRETDNTEIVEKLKMVNAKDLMQACVSIWNRDYSPGVMLIFDSMFKPCTEKEFEGQPVFINKNPISILKSRKFNKVPIIIGSNNLESAVIQYIKKDAYENLEKINEDPLLIVPKSHLIDEISAKKIGQRLIDFYFNGKVHKENKCQYLQLLSDYQCLYYVNNTVRMHSEKASECPIYYYILNFAGEWTVPKQLHFFNSTGHFAEIPLLFLIKPPNSSFCDGSQDSISTREKVVKMWTNFAKYGNPTPDEDDPELQITWDPVQNSGKLHYLSIGSELTKGTNPFHKRMKFWDQLHEEFLFLKTLIYFNDVGISW